VYNVFLRVSLCVFFSMRCICDGSVCVHVCPFSQKANQLSTSVTSKARVEKASVRATLRVSNVLHLGALFTLRTARVAVFELRGQSNYRVRAGPTNLPKPHPFVFGEGVSLTFGVNSLVS
jgi:hypothetical protein